VITDLGVMEPDPQSSELTLTQLHEGVELEQAREATGWELAISPALGVTPAPSERELSALRELLSR
jgi:glutaconate CoA-transferase subunit B